MRGVIATLVLVASCLGACQSNDVSRALGARCDHAADCADQCLPPSGEAPGGFCTRACTSTTECPGGAACADKHGGVCLFTCVFAEDCAFLGAGWTCKDTDIVGGTKAMVCRGD